jgi:hypothetical protein
MKYEIFTLKGEIAYQQTDGRLIKRAVLKPNGFYWKYIFYKGNSVGKPVTSINDQPYIKEFVKQVIDELA